VKVGWAFARGRPPLSTGAGVPGGVAGVARHAICPRMTQPSATDRIDAAIARIEAAARAQNDRGAALTRRHAALKQRMEEAVVALDEVIGRGGAAD
jgi:hypothetical protein